MFISCNRRAARGASPVAFVIAGLAAISLILVWASAEFASLSEVRKIVVLAIAGALIAGFMCLGWRIWVRPGPWKITPVLGFLVLEAVAEVFRFSLFSVVIVAVTLNFTVIAFRGALAMKRLQAEARLQSDLEVF